MNLKQFPLFADENVFRGIVDFLRTEGFDVKWVREAGLTGWKDADLMPIAFKDGRVIVTQDSDFGTLAYTQSLEFIGIIYLRPGHFPSEKHIATLKAILAENPALTPPFIITAFNNGDVIKIRIRNSFS